LSYSDADIVAYIESLERETKAIKEDLLRVCWYMRGGISYEDAMYLSQSERDIIAKIIKDNMETTKKSGMPFF
jgi:hypothetical protein